MKHLSFQIPAGGTLHDVELGGHVEATLALCHGEYSIPRGLHVKRWRSHSDLIWRRGSPSATGYKAANLLEREFEPIARPLTTFETPDQHFLVGEPWAVRVYPPHASRYEFEIIDGPNPLRFLTSENYWTMTQQLDVGDYRLRTRYLVDTDNEAVKQWSMWSVPISVVVHPEHEIDRVEVLRSAQHELAMAVERDSSGKISLIDPWQSPAAARSPHPVKWFKTAAYEGRTALHNMEQSYYADPLLYFERCLETLVQRGANFLTWHDLLRGGIPKKSLQIVLQLDVDGGLKSLHRVLAICFEKGVTGTIMIHAQAKGWYRWELATADITLLKQAEDLGWAIGYHNDCCTQYVAKYGRKPTVHDEVTLQDTMTEDVGQLRDNFDVRCYTDHGGVENNRVVQPRASLNLKSVDRHENPTIWSEIDSMFSDGGFVSRPTSLLSHISGIEEGRHFLRLHPFKYGNYERPHDSPPLDPDAELLFHSNQNRLAAETLSELNKQSSWLAMRRQALADPRSGEGSDLKPIRQQFTNWRILESKIRTLRATRRSTFLRQYPSATGDPRVFWWRMLDAYVAPQSKVLNVGALPVNQKEETKMFLPEACDLVDLDIDPAREPTILGDICEIHPDLYETFDTVLLFGLPYFSRPILAVQQCMNVLKSGGSLLLGCAGYTHPFRGGLYQPSTRPVFRREQPPLKNIGLKGNLWSFDEAAIHLITHEIASSNILIEHFYHYWFVVARK